MPVFSYQDGPVSFIGV